TSGGTVNIPGFGGSGKSVKLLSVTTTTSGKTFSKWTSGDNKNDSGTDIPGTPTPCISTDVGGSNGNITDAYAHFVNSNSAPTVAADNASRTVNEGATATNTGTYSDPDSGDNVAITASVGTVTKTGTNSGTWSWSFGTTDGPAQSQTVTITANDGNGHIVTTTFGLTVNNVAPTATFNAPASVSEGSNINLSLTSPSDPSTVDTGTGFTYAFDCGTGSGYGAFSGPSTASCPTNDNGSRTGKGEIKDKDGGTTEYTANVTINSVAPAVTAAANQNATEGSSASFSLGSFSDAGVSDNPWSVDVD